MDSKVAVNIQTLNTQEITMSNTFETPKLPEVKFNKNGYEIRTDILAMAKDQVQAEYSFKFAGWEQSTSRDEKTGKLVTTIAALCISALAWTTCARNEVWRTRNSLWEDAVAKSPGKYRTWSNLGGAYSNLGREDEAVKCFREALQIEPRFGFGSFNLSNSLLRLGRPQEALDALSKMIDLHKDAGTQPDVVYTVGLSLAGVGRYDEALAIFKRILEVMPDHIKAHKASAMVYRKTNNPQLALEHYRIIAKIQPPDENLLSEIRKTEAVLENPLNPFSNANFRLR